MKAPELLGFSFDDIGGFYQRNLGLFVLPLLTGYFAWQHRLPKETLTLCGVEVSNGLQALADGRFAPG